MLPRPRTKPVPSFRIYNILLVETSAKPGGNRIERDEHAARLERRRRCGVIMAVLSSGGELSYDATCRNQQNHVGHRPGLAASRPTVRPDVRATGSIVATYGSYASTDAGVFTDGSSLAAMAPIVILMLYLGATRKRLPKKAVFILTAAAIAIQSTATILLGVLILLPETWRFFELVLSTIITLASWIAIFYWLRRARGTSSLAAAAIAFGSLLLSEPIIYVASLLPRGMACITVGMAASLQFFFQKRRASSLFPKRRTQTKCRSDTSDSPSARKMACTCWAFLRSACSSYRSPWARYADFPTARPCRSSPLPASDTCSSS